MWIFNDLASLNPSVIVEGAWIRTGLFTPDQQAPMTGGKT